MGIWNVEAWKQEITVGQLRKWLAYYMLEPFGQPWLRAGRLSTLVRNALGEKYDPVNELRFLPTYREGDQFRRQRRKTPEEIAATLASIPGMKPLE